MQSSGEVAGNCIMTIKTGTVAGNSLEKAYVPMDCLMRHNIAWLAHVLAGGLAVYTSCCHDK